MAKEILDTDEVKIGMRILEKKTGNVFIVMESLPMGVTIAIEAGLFLQLDELQERFAIVDYD